jgi:WhiB family transcriptional regulator, redox-sensing transcriptional regulator
MDWADHAACLREDPELFFPNGNSGPALIQIEEVKAVCNRCPVVDACLRFALENGMTAGVWGGLTEGERRALTRSTVRPGPSSDESQNAVMWLIDARHGSPAGVLVPWSAPLAGEMRKLS